MRCEMENLMLPAAPGTRSSDGAVEPVRCQSILTYAAHGRDKREARGNRLCNVRPAGFLLHGWHNKYLSPNTRCVTKI